MGQGICPISIKERKEYEKSIVFGCAGDNTSATKNNTFLVALVITPMILSGCANKCEVEPIVAENHKLIVPPNFGNMPK